MTESEINWPDKQTEEEFAGDYKAYLAYEKAMAEGLVKIHGSARRAPGGER